MGRNSISDVRKPEILDHFIQVINEEGLDGASIAKVAGRMGIYPSLISHYFGNRENLILELIDHLIDKYNELYRSKVNTLVDPSQKIQAFLDLIFSSEYSNLGGPLVYLELMALALRNDKVRISFSRFNENFRNVLKTEFSKLEQNDASAYDHQQIVELIIYLTEGFHLWGFARNDSKSKTTANFLKLMILDLAGRTRP
ncbi:hypothetical protein JY97_10500 [Alkalispirochaeta odontotermitis]|nr:hypothetical protein JY97_10500 [Alkalispirochaeta odontotermitis]CAB1079391.1 hypothetical protein D1AOALGA4SA_7105 [Olavius algarvensis Delta 1 endosymbiont]